MKKSPVFRPGSFSFVGCFWAAAASGRPGRWTGRGGVASGIALLVPAIPLESEPCLRDQFFYRSPAGSTFSQRRVGKFLADFKHQPAVVTLIFVHRHRSNLRKNFRRQFNNFVPFCQVERQRKTVHPHNRIETPDGDKKKLCYVPLLDNGQYKPLSADFGHITSRRSSWKLFKIKPKAVNPLQTNDFIKMAPKLRIARGVLS